MGCEATAQNGIMKQPLANPCLLVGDIGGTNARFALADAHSPGFTADKSFECAGFPSIEAAIAAYLAAVQAPRPEVICIAAAGPIVNGEVRLTNNDWKIDSVALANDFDGARVNLLNDFAAIAYSIPYLMPEHQLQVGLPALSDLDKPQYTVGIVGPGTGLGAAGLSKLGGVLVPQIGEGGHVGFAPETQLQMDILGRLRQQFDRVSDERLVSGPGIVNMYRALCHIHHQNHAPYEAADIFRLGGDNSDPMAAATVQLFFEILGQVAGNLAMSLGAFDGMYIGGGIVARQPDLIINSAFRAGFERKGRHRSLMERIPTQLILHPQPGLLGASYCALQVLEGQF